MKWRSSISSIKIVRHTVLASFNSSPKLLSSYITELNYSLSKSILLSHDQIILIFSRTLMIAVKKQLTNSLTRVFIANISKKTSTTITTS